MSNNSGLDQAIIQLRNEVVLGQSKAEQLSLGAFDRIAQQMQQFGMMYQKSQEEVKRLQELCDKNNIQYKPKKEKPITPTIPSTKNGK